ncbi:MAG TPA: DUF503 domain-containing protein [Candidatus Dormibacteraeota bacterium]|nr:DUF503 domain-containing protein [Candidatus Dormibacteraeota bacterium]
MVVGTLRVSLHIPESHSLKEKRAVVRSLVERLRRTFNVSVAEVEDQDAWQVATIGVVCVSADARHADEMAQKALRLIEEESEAMLTRSSFELLHV